MLSARNRRLVLFLPVLALVAAGLAPAGEDAAEAPSPAEQVAQLTAMCDDTAAARQARQQATPLFQRLGGEERILELTREVVRLHQVNEAIRHYFEGVDTEQLAMHVAQFMAAGTGCPQNYSGRDLVSSHADLELTDADFMAAGGDIIQAMKSMGHGQNEIDEVVCILVSLKDQVVLE